MARKKHKENTGRHWRVAATKTKEYQGSLAIIKSWEKAREDSAQSEQVWPWQYLDFGLLDSKTVREYIPQFVVLSYSNPRKQNYSKYFHSRMLMHLMSCNQENCNSNMITFSNYGFSDFFVLCNIEILKEENENCLQSRKELLIFCSIYFQYFVCEICTSLCVEMCLCIYYVCERKRILCE